jgi:hypothetical protein
VKITITIKKGGVVEAQVEGVAGTACEGKLDAILSGFGDEVEREYTGEYYEVATETEFEQW